MKLIVGLTGTVTVPETGNKYNITAGLTSRRSMDWVLHWVDDDYDGAPDAGRQYLGEAETMEDLFAQIREAEEERAEEGR